MGLNSLRNIGRVSIDTNVCTETLLGIRQWRFPKCTRSPEAAHSPYNKPWISRPFSTSSRGGSNSNSKVVGLIGWYMRKLNSHPLATKTLSTSLIYAASDLTAQKITSPQSGSFDWIRTLRMAGYGLLILGPSQHLWFNYMSKVFPERDMLTTLKKIFMGQAVYGPANASIFFSYNAALQGENSSEIAARLKRDLLPTLKNGLLYWPVCDFVTYKFVPVHLQVLDLDAADHR